MYITPASTAGTEGFAINAACLALETFTQKYEAELAEARRQALEEAAKVAERCSIKLPLTTGGADGASMASRAIAQAIRAHAAAELMDGPGDGKEGV